MTSLESTVNQDTATIDEPAVTGEDAGSRPALRAVPSPRSTGRPAARPNRGRKVPSSTRKRQAQPNFEAQARAFLAGGGQLSVGALQGALGCSLATAKRLVTKLDDGTQRELPAAAAPVDAPAEPVADEDQAVADAPVQPEQVDEDQALVDDTAAAPSTDVVDTGSPLVDLPDGTTERVRKLADDAAEARQLRWLEKLADVRVLRLGKQRKAFQVLVIAALAIGLASTLINVQAFAAIGEAKFSPGWFASWGTDAVFSLGLVGILLAEGWLIAADHPVKAKSVKRTKRFLLGATTAMNCWNPVLDAIATHGGPTAIGHVVLHGLIPIAVFGLAEVLIAISERFADAIRDVEVPTQS